MNNSFTQSLFRMSAVLYAHNNNEAISQRQIIRKVIEDALLQYNKNDITETELSSFIEENYHLSISENEILDTINDRKFYDDFNVYKEKEKTLINLAPKRVHALSQLANEKSLPNYISDFLFEDDKKDEKCETLFRFLYTVFTTNLEGYKLLLKEKTVFQPDGSTFSDEDKELINAFLDWDNPGKNKAIYNLASYALEYCMLTNDKNTTLDLQSLRNKEFYLDTNILFRAIGLNGDDRKERTLRFLSKFKDVKETLKISSETRLEFTESINYYISKLEKAEQKASYVSSKIYVEYVDIDGIFKAYHKWKLARQNASPALFKAHLMSVYQTLLDEYQIEVDCLKPYEDDEQEDLLKGYSSQIYEASGDNKQRFAAEHDAKNILWIEKLRSVTSNNIFNTKAFFISSDQHLRRWDYYRNSNNVPIVMLPSQWLSLILRYMERSDDDYKSFVCFLNIKTSKTIIGEEQMQYIISGIGEMTTDINKERYIVKSFIQDEFENGINDLNEEELAEKARNYAKSLIEDENDSLRKANEDQKTLIENLQKEIAANQNNNEKVTKEKTTQDKTIKEQESTISSQNTTIDELSRENKKYKLDNWKRPRYIGWTLLLLLCIGFIILSLGFQNWDYNPCKMLILWIDSLSSDTQKEIGKWLVLLPCGFAIYIINQLYHLWKTNELPSN